MATATVSGGTSGSGVVAPVEWLKWLDGMLRAVERLAWQARSAAELCRRHGRRGVDEAADRSSQVAEAWHRGVNRWDRVRDCGTVLAKIAASYRLQETRAAFSTRRSAERNLRRLHQRNARRFVRLSQRSGGAFLKVGQLLSARADILPEVWIKELSVLQDAAPCLHVSVVQQVIERELGAPLSTLFQRFDHEPLGCASIGQVHRAVTHDGRQVAVKVQRPGIAELVDSDLRLLNAFVRALMPSLPRTDYDTVLRELSAAIVTELDYVHEAQVMARVAELFEGDTQTVIPRPLPELSNGRVLTATFIEGRKLTLVLDELQPAIAAGDSSARARRDEILGRVVSAYAKQVLTGGVFQADPHPGNLLVTADDRVVVLDYGCSQSLEPEVRGRYLDLLSAFLCGNRVRMDELFRELGFVTESGASRTLHEFADALLSELSGAAVASGTREPTSAVFARLLETLQRDPVLQLPPSFVLLARVFTTLGGLFVHYDAKIDVQRHVLPHVATAMAVGMSAAPSAEQ